MQTAERGYAIIGTPRSGTSHLCWLLTSTGILGKPAEYLHPDHAAHVTGPSAAVPGSVWDSIRTVSRTENGVYAIKTFRKHLARCTQPVHREILSLPLVFVTREDKLAQAISLARAFQTSQWNSTERQAATAGYDAAVIRDCLDEILLDELAFRQTVALHGLPVLTVTYEHYVERQLETVKAIGALVGVDVPDTDLQSPLVIQRDAINTAWRDRFVAEQGPILDVPLFTLNDRWSRLGRTMRRIKRRLPIKHW